MLRDKCTFIWLSIAAPHYALGMPFHTLMPSVLAGLIVKDADVGNDILELGYDGKMSGVLVDVVIAVRYAVEFKDESMGQTSLLGRQPRLHYH